MEYLFVYGTLMRKSLQNEWAAFLQQHADYLGEAMTEGVLYQVDYYPGLVKENGTVYGELYALEDPSYVLHFLDQYEDYFPQEPSKSLYLREKAMITLLPTAEKKEAWLYYYNQATDHLPRYPDGRFAEK